MTYPNFDAGEDEFTYLATAPGHTWLFNGNYSALLDALTEAS